MENYYFNEIPKNKLSNTLLMKETIKYALIHELSIPEEKIIFDYPLKDKNDKIHRFELIIQCVPKINIIFRLIYAKDLDQAEFWIKRITYEKDVIKKIEPKSRFFVIVSGIAFKKIIEINNGIKGFLIPLPGWEHIYELPNLLEKLKNIDSLKAIKKPKQISLDNF